MDEEFIPLAIVDEPAGDSAPQPVKRGRGRPRKNPAPVDGVMPTPGADSPPRTRSVGRKPNKNSVAWVRAECQGLVAAINSLVVLSPFRADALNETEMSMLADAATAEAMTSDRIRDWLVRAAGISPHVLMVQAVALIAMPRLARRGMLPGAGQPIPPEMMDALRARAAAEQAERDAEFFADAQTQALDGFAAATAAAE